VVAELALGILEWPNSMDCLDRPRLRWLARVSVLQRGKERQLVRFWVRARRGLPNSGGRKLQEPATSSLALALMRHVQAQGGWKSPAMLDVHRHVVERARNNPSELLAI
jgi:hypothetical protein